MFGRLVGIIIALLVLVVIAIGMFDLNVGLGGRILDNYHSVVDQQIRGSENDTYGDAPRIPIEHQETLKQLEQTINRMLTGEKADCFGNYKTIPSSTKPHSGFPEFKEDGPTITITYDPNRDVSTFTVMGGAGGKQEANQFNFEVKHMIPCVIGGKNVARDFFSVVINDEGGKNYFKPVSTIQLGYSDGGYFGFEGNSIIAQGVSPGNNFKDGGWLYTPDKNHICFFPTGSEGSDEDFISGQGDNTLSSIIPREGRSC